MIGALVLVAQRLQRFPCQVQRLVRRTVGGLAWHHARENVLADLVPARLPKCLVDVLDDSERVASLVARACEFHGHVRP